jgi:hypothetical protein
MNRFFCLLTYFLKKNFVEDENKRFNKGRFKEASESSWVEKEKDRQTQFQEGNKTIIEFISKI